MDEKSKIKSYPLKIDKKSLDELKELAPAYGHSTLASFIRWILINFYDKSNIKPDKYNDGKWCISTSISDMATMIIKRFSTSIMTRDEAINAFNNLLNLSDPKNFKNNHKE